MDLATRMYIGYGTSYRSEKAAFAKATKMAEHVGMASIRLDKYYSAQTYVEFIKNLFGKDVSIYIIPKKNATVKGPLKWKKTDFPQL
ncbi:hypothetical protein HY772_06840 [Candidatus Woesearchaeota archaeon]|nr:hypothetical protein [Candidatus Woesearchaeota archaeon]